MDVSEWYQLIETSLEKTCLELSGEGISVVFLFNTIDDSSHFFVNQQNIDESNSSIFNQVWKVLGQILTNELYLRSWNSITITGRTRAITIKSFLSSTIFISLIHDIGIDTNEFMKLLLKYIAEIGFHDQYETIGLVASEGYPVWVISETETIDEFLFAISITSLLSLVERIDMEVSAGGISRCLIKGNDSINLTVSFNPSRDLALAITQKEETTDSQLSPELKSIYESITDPTLFSAIVPEKVDPERDKILAELQEDDSGEVTSEELQSLNVFDTETLSSLVSELNTITRNYQTDQISIGYLRKRMKLPGQVLHMALEYLISNGEIKGKIGREIKSGKEILVLESQSERTQQENENVAKVNQQIGDLFSVLNPFLNQLPDVKPREPIAADISEALSEFLVLQSLADTDSLFLLIADLRILNTQLVRSIRTISVLQKQVEENIENLSFVNELKIRLDSLIEKYNEQRTSIILTSKKLMFDIVSSYRLILRILPIPSVIKYNKAIGKISLVFKCHHAVCGEFLYLYDDPEIWRKIIYFAFQLDFIDSYPDGWENLSQEVISKLNGTYKGLKLISDSIEETPDPEDYNVLNELDKLIVSNTARDSAIQKLRTAFDKSNNQLDYYDNYKQCNTCQNWYCTNHLESEDKCLYC
ncbi:MAG: hypothetical protein ACXACP_00440 [Candidatus Hodarchaeales archaeon]|jgi:hypothetical protein